MAIISKNDFSWSLQRIAMFERCKREYFYHYYGSWQGWVENAEEKVRLIYRLKNIRNEDAWIKTIIEKTFSSAIKREIEFSLVSCKSSSIRAACRDIFELEKQEYLRDPKKLCLDTVYFAEESVDTLRRRITARLECFWNILWENSLFRTIREKQYGDFIRIGGTNEFILDGVKVWLNPGILYLEEDNTFIVDIYPESLRNENKSALYMSLAILFMNKTCNYAKWKTIPMTIVVGMDNCTVLTEYYPAGKMSSLIKKSSSDMLSYLTIDKKAHEENFPETDRKEKCRTCRFRETCAA